MGLTHHRRVKTHLSKLGENPDLITDFEGSNFSAIATEPQRWTPSSKLHLQAEMLRGTFTCRLWKAHTSFQNRTGTLQNWNCLRSVSSSGHYFEKDDK